MRTLRFVLPFISSCWCIANIQLAYFAIGPLRSYARYRNSEAFPLFVHQFHPSALISTTWSSSLYKRARLRRVLVQSPSYPSLTMWNFRILHPLGFSKPGSIYAHHKDVDSIDELWRTKSLSSIDRDVRTPRSTLELVARRHRRPNIQTFFFAFGCRRKHFYFNRQATKAQPLHS